MKAKLVFIVGAAVLVCAGCGNAHPGASRQPQTNPSGHQVEVSRAKSYQTMSELRKDATAVLRVTATAHRKSTPADQAGQGPLRAILTTVHVDKVISGALASGTVQIRQFSPGGASDEFPLLLAAGQAYYLYVMPFEFVRGHPIPGIYVVVGDVGQFHVEGDGTLRRALPGVGELPTTLTQTQLEQDAATH
ncbi:MAG: hypothetical protein ACR2JO_10640 [Mycobacteriales bacterium]